MFIVFSFHQYLDVSMFPAILPNANSTKLGTKRDNEMHLLN